MAALALAATFAVFGCNGAPAGDSGSAEPANSATSAPEAQGMEDVQTAAMIAREVEANPDRAAEILESHGMTQESFQQLMYEIAADPARSEAYEAARKAGGS